MQKDGSEKAGISAERVETLAAQAFSTWFNEADCGNGAHPSFNVEYTGRIECDKHEYRSDRPNANVIIVRDEDWPYDETLRALAMTTVTFNTETGEILDADMELNGLALAHAAGGELGQNPADLEAVILHEVGHMLGLADLYDSERKPSVMFGYYAPGKRSLTADDIAGVCEAFAPERTVSRESCEPINGLAMRCDEASSAALPLKRTVTREAMSCAFGPAQRSSSHQGLLMGMALVCWALVRARRQSS